MGLLYWYQGMQQQMEIMMNLTHTYIKCKINYDDGDMSYPKTSKIAGWVLHELLLLILMPECVLIYFNDFLDFVQLGLKQNSAR